MKIGDGIVIGLLAASVAGWITDRVHLKAEIVEDKAALAMADSLADVYKDSVLTATDSIVSERRVEAEREIAVHRRRATSLFNQITNQVDEPTAELLQSLQKEHNAEILQKDIIIDGLRLQVQVRDSTIALMETSRDAATALIEDYEKELNPGIFGKIFGNFDVILPAAAVGFVVGSVTGN